MFNVRPSTLELEEISIRATKGEATNSDCMTLLMYITSVKSHLLSNMPAFVSDVHEGYSGVDETEDKINNAFAMYDAGKDMEELKRWIDIMRTQSKYLPQYQTKLDTITISEFKRLPVDFTFEMMNTDGSMYHLSQRMKDVQEDAKENDTVFFMIVKPEEGFTDGYPNKNICLISRKLVKDDYNASTNQ